MSAWIVSDSHIDVLVKGLREDGVETDADQLGQLLLAECVKSVSCRYPNDTFDELPGPIDKTKPEEYRYVEPEVKLGEHNYAAAASCFDYQSCEHRGYESSEARRLISRLDREPRNISHEVEVDLTKASPWGFYEDHVHPSGRKVAA